MGSIEVSVVTALSFSSHVWPILLSLFFHRSCAQGCSPHFCPACVSVPQCFLGNLILVRARCSLRQAADSKMNFVVGQWASQITLEAMSVEVSGKVLPLAYYHVAVTIVPRTECQRTGSTCYCTISVFWDVQSIRAIIIRTRTSGGSIEYNWCTREIQGNPVSKCESSRRTFIETHKIIIISCSRRR
jgi:hypothetical protein